MFIDFGYQVHFDKEAISKICICLTCVAIAE